MHYHNQNQTTLCPGIELRPLCFQSKSITQPNCVCPGPPVTVFVDPVDECFPFLFVRDARASKASSQLTEGGLAPGACCSAVSPAASLLHVQFQCLLPPMTACCSPT